MSEKNTDYYMQKAYESIFNHEYHTETNPIFNGLIPDGWDIINDTLIIIENKRLIKEGYKEQKCECCGMTEWLGEPIPLELHHIDGNKQNHQLSIYKCFAKIAIQ